MRKISVWNPWGISPKRFFDMSSDDDWYDVSPVEMDVYEKGDDVIVEIKAPGFSKDDIDVSIESGKITIVGKYKEEKEEKDEDRKYYYREITNQSFTRSCELPVSVVPDKAEAKFENGILKITLPKSEEAKPKKIKIDVG